MGRGGSSGGGGHHGGGGGHHGGGGFHTGGSRSSSSSRSFSSSRSYGGGYRGGYRSGPTYYGGNRTYGGGGAGCGCLDGVLVTFIVVVLLLCVVITSCMGGFNGDGSYDSNGKAYVDEKIVNREAEKYYSKHFGGRDDVFLFYIAYSKTADDEFQWSLWGKNTYDLLDNGLGDDFCDWYADNYDDDLGVNIGKSINDWRNTILDSKDFDKYGKVESDGKFSAKDTYYDELNWIDTEYRIENAAKELYEDTGIVFHVAIVNYDKFPDVKNVNSKVGIWVFLIGVVVLIILCVSYNWWKKKKAQKNKEAEDAIKILNTPLESFGDVDNLAKKYDDAEKAANNTSSSSSNDSVYFGSNNNSSNDNNNI